MQNKLIENDYKNTPRTEQYDTFYEYNNNGERIQQDSEVYQLSTSNEQRQIIKSRQLAQQKYIQGDNTVDIVYNEPKYMQNGVNMSANFIYLLFVMVTLDIPGLLIGYSVSYQNQATKCFEAKFGWITAQDKALNNAIIGTSEILGMTFGAIVGGILMKIGRRKSLIMICFIGMTGNIISFNFYLWTILLGRFVFGFATGLSSSIVPRIIEETVPSHIYDSMGVTYPFSQTVGTIIAMTLGQVLPNDNDIDGLKATNNWRIIYVYVPIACYIITLLGLFFVFKEDSIKFLIMKGDREEETRSHVKKMYKYAKNDEQADVIIKVIKGKCSNNSSGLTLKDALFNPQYRRATWINIVQIIFHECTGINVINFYSNTIFSDMNKTGQGLTPRQGTYLVGVAQCVSSLLSVKTIKYIGRRPLLIYGHLIMALVHASVAIFNIQGMNSGVVSMILLFLVVYQNTSGPVTWLYTAETTIDSALGICLLTLWGTATVLTLICPPLMSEDSLGPNNVFFIFSGISFCAMIFMIVYIKETKGLTDYEKKTLFTPNKFLKLSQE